MIESPIAMIFSGLEALKFVSTNSAFAVTSELNNNEEAIADGTERQTILSASPNPPGTQIELHSWVTTGQIRTVRC